ncbi:hypothetical protein HPB48_014907 [Haemaphysalis longicornis]|uniref:Peptidase M13 N-terminal domain-containing protein n=1 Tax=Haemaphysalis longicornis TaxID=44386 RepID=A0A9J6GRX1_HAELO|nr:hypothetical protein HPB48_014907 [Haemaphysalis longicornis]
MAAAISYNRLIVVLNFSFLQDSPRSLTLKSLTELKSLPSVACAVVVVVLGVILAGVLVSKALYKRENASRYCTSEHCLAHWSRLNEVMDWSVDPCKNFSAFVCGRWKPDTAAISRSTLDSMVVSWQDNFEALLEKAALNMTVAAKPIAMLQSCRSKLTSNLTVSVFKQFMKNLSLQWPEEPPPTGRTPLEVLVDLSYNWQAPLWFRVELIPDGIEQPRQILVRANGLISTWDRFFREIPTFEAYRIHYTSLFKKFSRHGRATTPTDEAVRKSLKMQSFVYDVLQNTSSRKSREPIYLPMDEFANLTKLEEGRLSALSETLALSPPLHMHDMVTFTDVAVHDALKTLFNTFNRSEIMAELSWMFVQAYGALADPEDVLFGIYGSRDNVRIEWPRYCARQVESSYELLAAALQTLFRFTDAERRRINRLLGRILRVCTNYCI